MKGTPNICRVFGCIDFLIELIAEPKLPGIHRRTNAREVEHFQSWLILSIAPQTWPSCTTIMRQMFGHGMYPYKKPIWKHRAWALKYRSWQLPSALIFFSTAPGIFSITPQNWSEGILPTCWVTHYMSIYSKQFATLARDELGTAELGINPIFNRLFGLYILRTDPFGLPPRTILLSGALE